jgi:phage-related protein
MSWTIEFYRNKNGRSPVEKFLIGLDKKSAVKVYGAIKLLKKHGIYLREPYVKNVEGKIFELRVKDSRGIYRILYFAASGEKFVLLHGLVKKKKKTPKEDISKARQRLKEYTNG